MKLIPCSSDDYPQSPLPWGVCVRPTEFNNGNGLDVVLVNPDGGRLTFLTITEEGTIKRHLIRGFTGERFPLKTTQDGRVVIDDSMK